MKVNYKIYILVFILVLARVFIENGLTQIGLDEEKYTGFVSCGSLGCFLKFKYRFILEFISFAAYYIIGIKILQISKRWSIFSASMFVLIFMMTQLYHEIGNVFFQLVFDFIKPLIEVNNVLFWSISGFIGMIISLLIMTIGIRIILKKRIGNVT